MTDRNAEIRTLAQGASALGLQVEVSAIESALRLLDELERWSRAYNLTAIDARSEMLTHHLLDSWSITKFLHGTRIIDVGTGAGFPGLPLAILAPDKEFTLLEIGRAHV